MSRRKTPDQTLSRRAFLKRMGIAPVVLHPASFYGLRFGFPFATLEHPPLALADFRLKPSYPARSPLEDVLRRVPAGSDELVTEKYASEIEMVLRNWSESLRRWPRDQSVLARFLDPSITAFPVANAKESTVRAGEGIDVTRRQFGSSVLAGRERFLREFGEIAGTIAANAHGRGLKMRPFISDVESFVLVDGTGTVHNCSRTENPELFRLVHGGYGLFGVVTSVQLRLIPRKKVERVVEMQTVDDMMAAFDRRISAGFLYGDFQFSIDRQSEDFLHRGVFSCYRPVPMETRIPTAEKQLSNENWRQLLYLAHVDKKKAFERYAEYYLSTNGQVYWSDTHQLSIYPDDYHRDIDQKLHAPFPATEIICEIDVPRPTLKEFFDEVREDFRKNNVELIYGTVRLIEQDDESFLPWAKQSYACTIFNLHTVHTPEGVGRSADIFRRLIDMAARRGGSFYLTYHRDATRKQIESCYPRFAEFLRLKRKYDPEERFQSEWYRDYKKMFADSI